MRAFKFSKNAQRLSAPPSRRRKKKKTHKAIHNTIPAMLEPMVQNDYSSDCQSKDSQPFWGPSSSVSSSTVSNEELKREISWNPLTIVNTLSGFNPEGELEYAWTPDDSSAGDVCSSFATENGSFGFSVSDSSTTASRQIDDERTVPKLDLSSTIECSPSQLKLDDATHGDTKRSLGPAPSNVIERLQGDDMREYDIITARSGIEIRESNESELRNSHLGKKDGVYVANPCTNTEEMEPAITLFDHTPTARPEQEFADTDTSPTLMHDSGESCQDPINQARNQESASSVEISLIEKPKSATRLKRLKRVVRAVLVKKQGKIENENKAMHNLQRKDSDEWEPESPLLSSSSSLRTLPSSKSWGEATHEVRVKEESSEHLYSVGVLTAVSTMATSNVTRDAIEREVEYANLATVTETDTTDVGKTDICFTAIGLGCLLR